MTKLLILSLLTLATACASETTDEVAPAGDEAAALFGYEACWVNRYYTVQTGTEIFYTTRRGSGGGDGISRATALADARRDADDSVKTWHNAKAVWLKQELSSYCLGD